MSEKRTADYQKLIKHLDIKPGEFMMIGNSVKSDILPVLELGGWGVHVPYHTTWAHELVDVEIENEQFKQVEKLDEVLVFL
jgi:putative hydrolase of the HAD superfamily